MFSVRFGIPRIKSSLKRVDLDSFDTVMLIFSATTRRDGRQRECVISMKLYYSHETCKIRGKSQWTILCVKGM